MKSTANNSAHRKYRELHGCQTPETQTNGEAVMNLMRELHAGGATICMVTHDPRYAKYADRTFHLFDGQVVGEGEAGEAAVLTSEQKLRESSVEAIT